MSDVLHLLSGIQMQSEPGGGGWDICIQKDQAWTKLNADPGRAKGVRRVMTGECHLSIKVSCEFNQDNASAKVGFSAFDVPALAE